MRSSRRAFVVALATAPFAGYAQQAQKPLRIGILSSGTTEVRGHLDNALIRSLAEQGYVEGRNLEVLRRYRGAEPVSRMHEFASELRELNLDAVVTTCTPSTAIAKSFITTTPIIMAAVSDPVGSGLVASLARPGGNITGLSSQGEELLPKMMEYFGKVLPKAATVAVLGHARNPVHARKWQRLRESPVVKTLALNLLRAEFSDSSSLTKAVETATGDGASALFVLGDDPLALNLQRAIVQLAVKHRLPDFYWAREFVDAGGLMSYGESLRSDYRSVGVYVARVAKGAKPADLPVQQPTRFELVINRKRANALGLVLPQDLLVLADQVIE